MKVLKDDAEFVAGVMRCVKCSICVPHCPSYSVFKNEGDSPRGRVQLMRAAVLGQLVPDSGFEKHMDNCLGCRACEDVCPSGVPFGLLIDKTHAQLLASNHGRMRKLMMRGGLALLAHREWLLVVARILRIIQWFALGRFVGWLVRPFSRATARRIQAIPRICGAPFIPQPSSEPESEQRSPAASTSLAEPTAWFLSGCVMAGALGDVQRATVRVLERSGHRVATPAAQVCCGALHLHAGYRDDAIALARKNLDAFSGDAAICVNSAGCSLALKGYARLLPDDPRAAQFVARIRDLSELVGNQVKPKPLRVAVQESCHHHNVQRLRGRAATLLTELGVTVVPLPRGAGCCGAAGVWSATHPEPAWALLQPLLDAVEASGCEAVVSSNPGCLMFLRAGLRERNSPIRALHLAELLDDQP